MYNKDYYINSSISNYQDYTKKKYGSLCDDILSLGIDKTDRLLDYWCATGALLKEFIERWYEAEGMDISTRAVQYGREVYWLWDKIKVAKLEEKQYDYVLMLDVLEHIEEKTIDKILDHMVNNTNKWLIVRLPVCKNEWEDYVFDVSRNDKTHIQRHTKERWTNKFKSHWLASQPIIKETIYDSEGVLASLLSKWE
jgi:SAM-dependent methyltransferase